MDVAYHSQRLSDRLTIFIAEESDTIVGFRVKQFSEIISQIPQDLDFRTGY